MSISVTPKAAVADYRSRHAGALAEQPACNPN